MATKVTQISLTVSVALGKHEIAQQLLGHHCSVRSEKQTAMAENSLDWCWYVRCTKMLSLSRSGFKHANCLLSLTRCQSIPASVPLSISWMNARYETSTVGREMWITYNAVCIIIHQGLENVETFSSRPRPRPRLFLQDQDQDQDFYFKTKTKTKTISHVLEAPRDQDQGLETTSRQWDMCME